jgi:hypothetical protein
MQTRTSLIALAALCAGVTPAAAGVLLGTVDGTVVVSSLDGPAAFQRLKAPGLPWLAFEVLPDPQTQPAIVGLSNSPAGTAVHSIAGGSLTTTLFDGRGPGVQDPPSSRC